MFDTRKSEKNYKYCLIKIKLSCECHEQSLVNLKGEVIFFKFQFDSGY